jgi:hypothetical protein
MPRRFLWMRAAVSAVPAAQPFIIRQEIGRDVKPLFRRYYALGDLHQFFFLDQPLKEIGAILFDRLAQFFNLGHALVKSRLQSFPYLVQNAIALRSQGIQFIQ